MFTDHVTHLVQNAVGCTPEELHRRHRTGPLAPLARLVTHLAGQLSSVERQLADQIAQCQGALIRAAEALEQGRTINDLGILQQAGAQVDLLAARHGEALHALEAALRAYLYATAARTPTTDGAGGS